MTFLSPLALLFALGIVVPIIIHLLNPDAGKKVYLGSIKFLDKVKETQQPNYRIQDWLLLLMRCLMIILISLLLAQWLLPQPASKTVVLVPQNWPENFSNEQQLLFDELESDGAHIVRAASAEASALGTLDAVPNDAEQHVFVHNSANQLPHRMLPYKENRYWHIAPYIQGEIEQSEWLLLYSARTANDVEKMARLIESLPGISVTLERADSALEMEARFDFLLNFSGAQIKQQHYQLLNLRGQLLTDSLSIGLPASLSDGIDKVFTTEDVPQLQSTFQNNHHHHVFDPRLLIMLEQWVSQPWFAVSLATIYEQPQQDGAISESVIIEQLQSLREANNDYPVHWQLVLALVICWLLERFLAFRKMDKAEPT